MAETNTGSLSSLPPFIKKNGFQRSLDEKSDEILLNILDLALTACNYEITKDIQKLILYFTPFSKISSATDVIISLESYPMKAPNFDRIDDILVILKDKIARKRIADLANDHIEYSLNNKVQRMHPFWYYIASYSYRMAYGTKKLNEQADKIYILVRQLLLYGRPLISDDDFINDSNDTLPIKYGQFKSHKEKQFTCSLLSYWNQSKNKNLKQLAETALNVLAVDYDKLYDILLKNKSPILNLKIPQESLCDDKEITSQREVMGKDVLNDLLTWYNLNENVKPKGYVLSNDEDKVKEFFVNKMGLNDWDRVVKISRKSATNLLRKSEVMMMFYRLIGESLDKDFQNEMNKLYLKNREILNLSIPSNDKLCKLVSPPIKTISRARFKIREDYMKDAKPVEGSILDWVRCAIICENDIEMKAFFDLLCKTYKGNIIRMKNKFDTSYKVEGGYRAVMINMIWTNKDNPLLKMIVEIQLILGSYIPIRSKTHLFYKIYRSKSWRAMADDFAKFSDV